MSLGKGIASEAFDLAPDFAGLFGRIATLRTVFKKLLFHRMEFFAGTEFSGHSSPQYVCLGQGQARILVRNADDILLVDHDSVGFWENP